MNWREEQHPRDRRGRFSDRPDGWAQAVSDALTGMRGQDLRGKLNYDKLYEKLRKVTMTREGSDSRGDVALGDIYEQQGFHGRPKVVARQEMDRLIQSGHLEMFRGVAESRDGTISSAEYAQQFRLGDEHYPGFGMHGNGSYATTWQMEAQGYSDPFGEGFRQSTDLKRWPGVIRIALPPDARIAEVQRLKGQQAADLNQIRARGDDAKYNVLADVGRYAAALGYDAIWLGPLTTRGTKLPDAPPSRDHYIILNRSILTVQEVL